MVGKPTAANNERATPSNHVTRNPALLCGKLSQFAKSNNALSSISMLVLAGRGDYERTSGNSKSRAECVPSRLGILVCSQALPMHRCSAIRRRYGGSSVRWSSSNLDAVVRCFLSAFGVDVEAVRTRFVLPRAAKSADVRSFFSAQIAPGMARPGERRV